MRYQPQNVTKILPLLVAFYISSCERSSREVDITTTKCKPEETKVEGKCVANNADAGKDFTNESDKEKEDRLRKELEDKIRKEEEEKNRNKKPDPDPKPSPEPKPDPKPGPEPTPDPKKPEEPGLENINGEQSEISKKANLEITLSKLGSIALNFKSKNSDKFKDLKYSVKPSKELPIIKEKIGNKSNETLIGILEVTVSLSLVFEDNFCSSETNLTLESIKQVSLVCKK